MSPHDITPEWALQNRDAIVRAARDLARQGIELVTISMGADGALFATEEQVLIAKPPNIHVRSTVGAGDAMIAGIIAAQLKGLSLSDCARMATAFSVEALVRGESGVTSPSSIEAIMQDVTVEEETVLSGS